MNEKWVIVHCIEHNEYLTIGIELEKVRRAGFSNLVSALIIINHEILKLNPH